MTVAFTWNGLRALGVDETSLATFPEEFRQGMAARAEILGDTGANHPDNWVGGLAGPDLHAIAILFARDVAERARCQAEHDKLVARCEGVEVLSSLDLEATPPFDYAHDHFGYRDRLSQPVIEGRRRGADARFRSAAEGRRIHPRLSRRRRPRRSAAASPRSSRATAASWRIAAWRSTSARSATSCESTARRRRSRNWSPRSSWAAGAAERRSCSRRTKTIRRSVRTRSATTTSTTSSRTRMAMRCPLGSHIRRMNPRDTAANMNRRRMIRRGATYGPPLPEDAPEDGKERGIAAFVICASLVRQFEFAQNVWVNDRNFHELGNERDPIIGNQDGTLEFKIPQATDPQEDHRLAGIHDGERRRLFFPARPQGAAAPRRRRRTLTSREEHSQ